jgi:hypothetical protein
LRNRRHLLSQLYLRKPAGLVGMALRDHEAAPRDIVLALHDLPECENKTILTSKQTSRWRAWIFPRPILCAPRYLLERFVKRNSRRGRDVGSAPNHGGRTPCSQLKTRL